MPIICLAGCSSEPEKIIPTVHSIVISAMQFSPAELTIQKGDTVEFINKDMVVHDITQIPDKSWSSGQLPPGRSFKIAFMAGSDYYCSIHPVMKGKIIVQ